MIGMKHILVPTDFAEPSDRALTMAIELARAFDSRITLLHVWSVPNMGYAESLTWPIEDMQRAARKSLDGALATAQKQYPKMDGVLREGLEWRQILEAVNELGCDLVVMGTHGRHGLPRLVLGSVAEKVVRLSTVPVLSVGPAKEAKI